MKLLVGKREHFLNIEERAVLGFVTNVVTGGFPGNQRVFPGACNNCGHLVEHFLTEDVKIGEIYAEGPDACPSCGTCLSAENPQFQMLSQDAIRRLFGPADFSDLK